MKKKATYVVTSDFKTPYVRSTNNPRRPTEVKFKAFKKGEILAGEMQHDAKGKPTFVLYNGVCVIPLSVIKAVVTKEIITSSATGPGDTSAPGTETTRKMVSEKKPKIKYMDSAIVGALIGLGIVYLANKKNWIKVPDNMHYAYGAGIGALAGAYFVYRNNNKPKNKIV